MTTRRPLPATLLLALLLSTVPLGACSSGGGKADAKKAAPVPSGPRVGDDREIKASALSAYDRQMIAQAWHQFVNHSPLWPLSLRGIVERGGAGPYILSENLFRYFFQASITNRKADIERVIRSVAVIGEPAAAYFAKPLVTDLVPLGKEVVCEVPDPDDPKSRIKKTFSNFQIDDFTRRDAARVMVAIGPGAVPTLASPAVLQEARPSGRRYAAFALGRIATPEAVDALARHLRSQPDWQDRAAAAQALGAALPKSPAARAPLQEALRDPDPFVRRKADEALAGKTKLPI
jgi:hypothetical protein